MADDALQQAAAYRTGVGSRLLNLATGGLFGYVSGQQQKEQEAEWARRAMAQEQMLRERMRAMREQAVLEDIATERRKAEQAGESGLGAAFAYSGAPTSEPQMTPFFGAGYRGAQAKMGEQEAEERRNLPRDVEAMRIAGMPVPENVTPAQARAGAIAASSIFGQREATRQQAEQAKVLLREQGVEFDPNATPEEILGLAQNIRFNKTPVALKIAEKEQKQLDAFHNLTDEKEIQRAYSALPKQFKEDETVKKFAGIKEPMPMHVRKELDSMLKRLDKANQVLGTIDKFAQGRDIEPLSALTFNSLRTAITDKKSKIFGSDQDRMLANDIVQQFEQLVARERKDLFGVTLSPGEQASAIRQFGDPNSADFLQRAVKFIENLFYENNLKNYSETYRGTESYLNQIEKKMATFENVRPRIYGGSTLERFQQGGAQPARTNAAPSMRIRYDGQGKLIQ